jgi:hypothetical protein
MKKLAIIIIIASTLVGCYTERANERRLNKAVALVTSRPLIVSKICSEKFPIKETTFVKEPVVVFDTLWQLPYNDTIVSHDTIYIVKTLPSKTITKTIYKEREVVKENTAKIEEQKQLYIQCESKYQKLYLQWEEADKKAKARFWWLIVLIALITGFILRKPIASLILKVPVK